MFNTTRFVVLAAKENNFAIRTNLREVGVRPVAESVLEKELRIHNDSGTGDRNVRSFILRPSANYGIFTAQIKLQISKGRYRMKKVFLSLVSWALISSLAGVAPVAAAPRQGASELQVSGGFFHAEDTDFGNLNLDLSYGYYLSPGWQLGFRQALNYLFVDDASDQWIATTAPFINYHFRVTDIIVPYLGAFIGAAWNDDDVTGTLGPQVGVKLFVHDQTFVNLGYRYEWFWDKFERINNESDNGNHIFNIGVGFTWGGSGASTRRP